MPTTAATASQASTGARTQSLHSPLKGALPSASFALRSFAMLDAPFQHLVGQVVEQGRVRRALAQVFPRQSRGQFLVVAGAPMDGIRVGGKRSRGTMEKAEGLAGRDGVEMVGREPAHMRCGFRGP